MSHSLRKAISEQQVKSR